MLVTNPTDEVSYEDLGSNSYSDLFDSTVQYVCEVAVPAWGSVVLYNAQPVDTCPQDDSVTSSSSLDRENGASVSSLPFVIMLLLLFAQFQTL